ncbi:hypothetical protein TIFTF001_020292 [Ficus carica]|uniref:Uncharacterized protein n=1 Tax=Ficus carica TaxID=3494 RepID=A0AA88DJK5_FICCA|nr:hypothetical protein TIFTF001_020292 [Ficus carica]
MDPIVHYLTESELPENREKARRVKNTSARQLLWFPDHGVRSHDRAPTRIGCARAGSKTSAFADNSYGSRTTELGPTTGHQPELDVPEQDPRLNNHDPTMVGVGSILGSPKATRGGGGGGGESNNI